MERLNTNANIVCKLTHLLGAAMGGIMSKDRNDIQKIVAHGYESNRASSNPSLLEMELRYA
ncbi:MAG: hypothetical protein NZM26_04225 [Patescibacteria group bacterium]|nr:hypothetical protein [Patescibacteria group bacterium]